MKKVIPILLVIFLVGCGGQYTDAEEKVKNEMKVLNTYVEDKENPEFDEKLEESITSNMSEEEIAEREVEVELGLRSNVEGTYETYGIHADTKGYVADSVQKGLAIPKDGRVIEVVNGEDEETDGDSTNDLAVLMENQKERLNSLEVRENTQKRIDENDVNLKILSALRDRKSQIEQEIEEKKNGGDVDNDIGLQKQISELEDELEELEKNDRVSEDSDNTEDNDDTENIEEDSEVTEEDNEESEE